MTSEELDRIRKSEQEDAIREFSAEIAALRKRVEELEAGVYVKVGDMELRAKASVLPDHIEMLLTEMLQLKAENARMRPVVEAAKAHWQMGRLPDDLEDAIEAYEQAEKGGAK